MGMSSKIVSKKQKNPRQICRGQYSFNKVMIARFKSATFEAALSGGGRGFAA